MVHVNGKKVGGNNAVTKFTAYVNPYFVVSNGGAHTNFIFLWFIYIFFATLQNVKIQEKYKLFNLNKNVPFGKRGWMREKNRIEKYDAFI